MGKNVNLILKEALVKVKPNKEELKQIDLKVKDFLSRLKSKIKAKKINAETFVGGSFAKKTLIKKGTYDIDLFIRYDKKYKDTELSKITYELIKEFPSVSEVHGSRDYFRVKINDKAYIEIVPVKKISKAKDAMNSTDLSYAHVKYIKKKTKSEKILDEIRLSKAFVHASGCYGAESYVGGFSGYSLELLTINYRSFLKFIKAISNFKDRTIIDMEKHFKNKQEVTMDLNSSKLKSPVILIDPTYKHRNALAALTKETFEKFREYCKAFLKNPRDKFFEKQKIDFEKAKKNVTKRNLEFVEFKIKTDKQEGDVAGSKLVKFFNHLKREISRFFEIKEEGFEYDEKQSARAFFAVKRKKEIIIYGPSKKDAKNLGKFKKKHKNTFEKSGKIYAKEKINFNLNKFLKDWKNKNQKRMNEMNIMGLEITG